MIWVLLVLSLPMSFLLSGLEAALLSVSPVRLRHFAREKKNITAIRLEKLFARQNRLLSSVVLANNVINFLVFAVTTKTLVDFMGPRGYAVAIALCLPVYLLWLELLPKKLFKLFPYRLLYRWLPVLQIVFYTVGPFVGVSTLIAGFFQRKKGTRSSPAEREEFRTLAEIFVREGSLTSFERALIENVLSFHNVSASEVMIPLHKVTSIPLEMPLASALDLSRQTGLDQFPVMSPNGELVGLFNSFEALREGADAGTGTVVGLLRRLVRTHPNEKATTIMRRLRRNGAELAAVYNSEGRPMGVVSSEDLVNRLLAAGR